MWKLILELAVVAGLLAPHASVVSHHDESLGRGWQKREVEKSLVDELHLGARNVLTFRPRVVLALSNVVKVRGHEVETMLLRGITDREGMIEMEVHPEMLLQQLRRCRMKQASHARIFAVSTWHQRGSSCSLT